MRSLFPFLLFYPRFLIVFSLYITSSGAVGGQGVCVCVGGVGFDGAVGAALLSVVDLPDLSTVNRQGMSQSVLWPAESASLIHMSKHNDTHTHKHTHTHRRMNNQYAKGTDAAR